MKILHILLVDDEVNFRQALSRRLKKRNMDVLDAGNAEECLAILDKKPVEVVVSDVKMPGMDGIELLYKIKEKYPKIEVILLTGHASAPDGVSGIKSGAFDYLSKPVEFDHLLTKIHQAHEKILRLDEQKQEAAFRKKMEQQMIAAERLASLGTLATGIAHEINNPLAIILESAGWMGLILKKQADIPRKADFEKAIDKIETGVKRARRITHQLLTFARKPDAVSSQTDLNALMTETGQLLEREAINKGVKIVQEIREGDWTIFSDPYQIRQVLINLMTNAIHATNSGGCITMSLQKRNETVLLKVADTGEGIPPENLEKIFEPFFTTKSPGKGTGLGLFVTRGIIDRLGGSLDIKSRLGQGTTFYIYLPKYHEIQNDADSDHLDVLKKITQAVN